jgi:hypothetical protein
MLLLAQSKPVVQITYLNDDEYTVEFKPVRRKGGILEQLPGQDQYGYGMKITTDRMIRLKDNPTVAYRVYATCISNAASHWITRNNQRFYLR